MNPAAILDVVLAAYLVLAGLSGYRRGLLLTLVGAVGFLAGAALVLALLPDRLALVVPAQPPLARPMLLIAVTFLVAMLCQVIAVRLIFSLAHRVWHSAWRGLDSALGAILSLAVAAVSIWFAGAVVRFVAPGPLAKAIADSSVVRTIDGMAVPGRDRVVGTITAALDARGFPRVFNSIGAEPIPSVAGADPQATTAPAVQHALASVLRIDSDAAACSRTQEGTGWVFRDGVVVTNAHVVAGARSVSVRTAAGPRHAKVVLFDPSTDLAALAVDQLAEPPLPLGTELARGDSAVVAGYPLGGPLRVDAARVRDVLQARGDDIYGTGHVQREVYSLLGTVQPGNSGGPLIGTDGRVTGVIFARSLDDAATGYALTLDTAVPILQHVDARADAVDTGPCARG